MSDETEAGREESGTDPDRDDPDVDVDPNEAGAGEGDRDGTRDERVRVWLVERTFSDDELNVVILVYATEDGRRYYRQERALTSFSGPVRETTAGRLVSGRDLGTVQDPETRQWYADEAARMASAHDPGDTI